VLVVMLSKDGGTMRPIQAKIKGTMRRIVEFHLVSVAVRLQRVTTETAHVSVPLTHGAIKPEKLIQAAIEKGRLPSTVWSLEGEAMITPLSVQTPKTKSATH
jgi:hypothetical protein